MIYQMYLIRNAAPNGESFLTLPEEHQRSLMAQNQQITQNLGGRSIVNCFSLWSNEEYYGWGVTEFPDEAARIEQVRRLEKIGWFKRLNAFTLLGTPIPEVPKPVEVPFPHPIYTLWMIRNDPAASVSASRHTHEENETRFNRSRTIQQECGGMTVLATNCYWSNEEYTFFGVDAYPGFEALHGYYDELRKLNWGNYITAATVLGIPMEQM